MMSHLPTGRLAQQLEALPRPQVRAAIYLAAAFLLLADLTLPMIGMVALYVPLVCAAAWRLGERETYLFALASTMLSLVPIRLDPHAHWTVTLASQAVLRLACSLFLAAMVRSFRRAFDRERFMARRDMMTGAMNKATFERYAEKMIQAAAAVDRALLLATIDMDDFKGLNDRHGHAAGDAVLRAFALSAAAALRRRDAFGRIGGDEFALLISVGSAQEGRETAAQLHERLNAVLAEGTHPVTFTMGAIVAFPVADSTRAGLMHEADRAMYRAKKHRRGSLHVESVGRDLLRSRRGQHVKQAVESPATV